MKRTLVNLVVIMAAVSTNTCAATLYALTRNPPNTVTYYEPVKL